MSTLSDTWSASRIRCLPVGSVAFDPTNSVIATCSGTDCVLYSTIDGQLTEVLQHIDDLVSIFFVERDKLLAISRGGDMIHWQNTGKGFQQMSCDKVTAFPVIRAFYLHEEKRCVLAVDHGGHITIANVMFDKSLANIAQLPPGLRPEQIAVTNSFVTYCSGKEVFVIPTDENSTMSPESFLCKTHIEGLGERNAANSFVRITALNDAVAATLAIGAVYVWSHVSRKGVQGTAFMVHWHKVAPHLALTRFGGLLSAGAEAVLCKFTLSGAGRPNMLPRLAAPVRDLAISTDGSHLAVILEDNSVHVVLTSSMTVLSSLKTVITCNRSLKTVFASDPSSPGTLVLNGKPGSLQWVDCANSVTIRQVSFSLENVADGDMSFVGITQTFPDVEQVFFTDSVIVTLEKIINFEEDHKRLRFWKRSKSSDLEMQVLESFMVPKDTISITGSEDVSLSDDKVILSIMSCGKVNVWIPCEDGKRFKLDPTRHIDKRYEFHAGSKIHKAMWASAHSEGAGNTDVLIVWSTVDMSEIEVLRANGRARSVEFDGRGHLLCATDRSVRCWMHVAMRFEFVWVVEQPLSVRVSPLGAFAWSGNRVMEFDVETAALKGCFELEAPIRNLIAMSDKDSNLFVVLDTEEGLYCARDFTHSTRSEARPSSVSKTPFASLAPLEAPSRTGARTALRPAAKAAVVRLLDGPCHALPPISHIAPLFIAQCLAPPHQQ